MKVKQLKLIRATAQTVVDDYFAFGHACGPGIPTFMDKMIALRDALKVREVKDEDICNRI